jgi:hypothetical protein
MTTIYRIWDRKSPRHKWQIVCHTDNVEHANCVYLMQLKVVAKAIDNNKWPDVAQVAYDTGEPVDYTHPGVLPQNAPMTFVATFTDHWWADGFDSIPPIKEHTP